MKRIILAAALALTSASFAAETRTAAPGAMPPAARIAELAWLEGTWAGEGLGGQLLEVFSAPADGQMVGHFRLMKGGKIAFYEIESFAETGGSLTYRVKHFGADLTGWEEKAEVETAPLVAVEKDVWFFDGVTYRRTGPDSMTATVRMTGKDGGSREAALSFRRVKR